MRLSDADRDRYLKTAHGLYAAATASLDARPRIESGLRSSSRRRTAGRRRRLGPWGLALAFAVTFAGSSAVVASALPDTRALIIRLLAQTPGGGTGIGLPAEGHGPVLQPPPLFPVPEPAYVPSGLDLRATSYNAGHAAGGRTSRTATLTHGSQANISPPPCSVGMMAQC